MKTLHTLLRIPLIFIALGLTTPLYAQGPGTAPDEEQPIHITADAMDIQDQKGISVYSGQVKVTQGSLTLTGDKITIYHPEREVEQIEAEGQPARFKRFDLEEQAWVTGHANFIDYRAGKRTVLLTGSAKVEQPGKHLITGPKLFYDMQNKTLQAESLPDEKKRISVTLMPEKSEP